MQHVSEYREPTLVRTLTRQIRATATRTWTLMEVCGGQTHSIVKHGLQELVENSVTFVHGPGCPVCVTPIHVIDQAILLAHETDVILCTFGDMLRVPGSTTTLLGARAAGARVELVYTPLDALRLAKQNPDKQIVLLAVGFETTAPATALAVQVAHDTQLQNFSALVSHVLVPPAVSQLFSDPEHNIDALLAAGHVCTIMGLDDYKPLAARFGVPIVATGFEPVDILQGVLMCVQQLERGQHEVQTQYRRAVASDGNVAARRGMQRVFEPGAQTWRGLGSINNSGLHLRAEFARFDAVQRFAKRRFAATLPKNGPATAQPTPAPRIGLPLIDPALATECISGEVLRGKKRPNQCPAFRTRCTPEHPLGSPMVSSEGACAAYARYTTSATS